jgi:predicted RNase H-like nuclease
VFYGIDGCRGGWCLAGLDAVGVRVLEVVPSFAEAARRTREATAVFVDIPIGLPDGKAVLFRTCDRLAKDELGPRGSSVFPVPVRPALEAPSYKEANRIQLRFTGQGLSRQSYALAPRILEVDAILRGGTLHGGRGGALHGGLLRGEPPNDLPGRVFESHPELCFARLNGGRPLRWPKRETLGVLERARLLRPFIGDPWGALDRFSDASTGALAAGPSSIDDVLDALVLAVHAHLSAGHGLASLPAEPEHDVYGLPMRIVTANVTFDPPPSPTAGLELPRFGGQSRTRTQPPLTPSVR